MKLPGLNVLDLSGNRFTETGMDSLREGIQGHANLRGRCREVSLWYHPFRLNCFCRFGLKTLLLDGNPLGSNGLNILTPGLRYNDTIQHFGISECGFRSDAMKQLKTVLEENSTILRLDTNRNRVTQDVSAAVHAEIEANNCVLKLTGNVHAVDANKLSIVVSTHLVK